MDHLGVTRPQNKIDPSSLDPKQPHHTIDKQWQWFIYNMLIG